MSWSDLAVGVLTDSRIGAPVDAATVDCLWAWSNAETAPYDLMRWFNPLNTTEKMVGSRDSGAQPGAHDVQIYPDLATGIEATVLTLINGFYPTILANLRGSVPREQWANACADLHEWGTGCSWISAPAYFGDAPGNITAGGFGTLTDIEIQARFVDLQNRLDPIGSGVRFTQFGLFYDENAPDLPDGSKPSVFAQLFHKQIRKEVGLASGSWTAADQQELDDVRATVHAHIASLAAAQSSTGAQISQAVGTLQSAIAAVTAKLAPAEAQQLTEAHDAIVKAAGIIAKDLAP